MAAIEPFINTIRLKLRTTEPTLPDVSIPVDAEEAKELVILLNNHFARLNREIAKLIA